MNPRRVLILLTLLATVGFFVASGELLADETPKIDARKIIWKSEFNVLIKFKAMPFVTAETKTKLKLLDSPPGKFFVFDTSAGKAIATIPKGTKLTIQENKIIRGFAGGQLWLRVSDENMKHMGWLKYGKTYKSSIVKVAYRQ